MKISQSIQLKVFAIFGSFTLLLTLLYTSINIIIAYVVEDEVLENILTYEAKIIEREYKNKGSIIQPKVSYITLYLDPEKTPPEIAKAYKNKTLESEVFTKTNEHYHIKHLYFDKNTQGLLVAEVTPFLTVSNASRGIVIIFSFVLIITLILSLWFAYRIAAKTTKPILLLTEEVMEQQSQGKTITLSAKQIPDEIGYLAHSIETALNKLKQLVKRESDFNRDVSHELRTPLTIVSNTLSLANQRPLSETDITKLHQATEQMNHIVTTLLTLARSESIDDEFFPLRETLEECVLSLHEKLDDHLFNVNLEIDKNCKLRANKQLFILLTNNLIENAIQHASEKSLLIRLNNNYLYFENKINTPITQENIEQLTEKRFKKPGSFGLGQGLYLVKRIAERIDCCYEIKSNNSVFQFILRLPKEDEKEKDKF